MWILEHLAEPDTVAVFFRAHHAVLDGAHGADIPLELSRAGPPASPRDLDMVRVEAGSANTIRPLADGL